MGNEEMPKGDLRPESSGKKEEQSFDKIERAENAVKRMEDAEKRLDDKIAKLTELEANRLLGGTGGGHIETMKSAEQLEQERAQKEADAIVKAFK
jgi:hypothetical protein